MATPPPFFMKAASSMHRTVLKLSGGRLGWNIADMPVIDLTTTGRTSGEPRSTMLTLPWQNDDTLAIVASAGGSDHHPDWYRNLTADPAVTVRTEDGERAMTARTITGDERAEVWAAITEKYGNYAEYQSATDREIPVVLLDPAD